MLNLAQSKALDEEKIYTALIKAIKELKQQILKSSDQASGQIAEIFNKLRLAMTLIKLEL